MDRVTAGFGLGAGAGVAKRIAAAIVVDLGSDNRNTGAWDAQGWSLPRLALSRSTPQLATREKAQGNSANGPSYATP